MTPVTQVVITDSVFPCSENFFYEIVLGLDVHNPDSCRFLSTEEGVVVVK
jgi:hypothetical protein